MSKKYWSSGLWDGRIFSSVPEMNYFYSNLNKVYEFQFVTEEKENYFTYNVKDGNITTRHVIDYDSGQIQVLTWMENTKSWMPFWSQPRSKCSVYALCGPSSSCNDFTTPFCNCVEGFRPKLQTDWDLGDKTGGCVRNTPLKCSQNSLSNSQNDGFLKMSNVILPQNSQTLAMPSSSEDCELACLKNCSCTAYFYNASGCFVWSDGFLNLQEQYNQSDASTFYLRLAASDLPSSNYSERKKGVKIPVIVSIIVGGGFGSLFVIVWIIMRRRRSNQMIRKSKAVGSSLVSFTYSELQHFTKNFSEKIGGGGFGSVFKGFLPGSTAIAVKKLEGLHQGDKQFRTEVSTIGTIQHVNLVRLLGFCSERSKRLLVYEFLPNGSLDTHLSYSNSNPLDWKTRYQIAVETARGLAYLHEKCRDCIIHCDIKPENILLDASFVAKVADFGLAKLVGREFSRVLTTMRGTRGYLAPEWITGVPVTVKADVYSYGMMLFEIISGRRNSEWREQSGAGYFPKVVASKLMRGDVQSLADHGLGDDANLEELERACKVACWCIQDDETCRPTMGQVVQFLEGIVDVIMPPVPKLLQLTAEIPEDIIFFYESSSNQSSKTRRAAPCTSEPESSKSSNSVI
ncbi:G-type lectin S-receptor-like serine/threonine-protein kinase [Canna indica]|uniref:G-type lectin S-receptor-like serine/threonine-protein kinase n=1 Tax=Canna indica TaxID=4628 RepID=A0AAQ3KVI9_9LILI|nr:G-type lectin S-receptor-like serine/threonine-protein kinase [Canna indica]